MSRYSRPAVFVSESKPLLRLIPLMQRQRSHCVVVVDEHGTSVGLAFLEDALEHVVGTIRDEFDDDAPAIDLTDDGSFTMPGRTPLPQAAGRLGLADLDDAAADTIGGHIVSLLGRLPEEGDQITLAHYQVTVTRVRRRRIESLCFDPEESPTPETGERG